MRLNEKQIETPRASKINYKEIKCTKFWAKQIKECKHDWMSDVSKMFSIKQMKRDHKASKSIKLQLKSKFVNN